MTVYLEHFTEAENHLKNAAKIPLLDDRLPHYKEAVTSFMKADVARVIPKDREALYKAAEILFGLAQEYCREGRNTEATEELENSIAFCNTILKGTTKELMGKTYLLAGQVFYVGSQFDLSFISLEKAKRCFDKDSLEFDTAQALQGLVWRLWN